MSYIEADCSLIKKDGQIIGVSLVAQPQAQAERFCSSMPKQLVEGEGDIKLEDGKIIFVNSLKDEVSFSIENEDALALQSIFSDDQRLGIYRDGIFMHGFKIVIEGMETDGKKIELTRL